MVEPALIAIPLAFVCAACARNTPKANGDGRYQIVTLSVAFALNSSKR